MKKRFLLVCLLAFILLVKHSSAVGIISPGSNIIIDFKPGLEQTLSFGVRSNMADPMNVNIGVGGGELSKYIELSDETIFLNQGETKFFTIKIKLPTSLEGLPPGDQQVRISAVESPLGGGIAARGAVSTHIIIRIPYPGKYVKVAFDTENVNVNESVDFKVTIQNFGTEDLKNARGSIDIFDASETKFKSIPIEEREIRSQSSEEIHKTWDTTGQPPGDYKAVATIYYFENKTSLEKYFKIGSLEVKIINYTKEFEKNKVDKFDILVESAWNSNIPELYADISIKKDNAVVASLKTPSIDLGAWQRKALSTYWDTTDVEEGAYNATITLRYSGQKTAESGTIYVSSKKQFFEIPAFINLSTTTMLIALILILIIIDVIWLIKKRKKRK